MVIVVDSISFKLPITQLPISEGCHGVGLKAVRPWLLHSVVEWSVEVEVHVAVLGVALASVFVVVVVIVVGSIG